MIQIQVTWSQQGVHSVTQKEFVDHAEAAKWLIEDSYFNDPDVIKVVWEQRECRHSWNLLSAPEDDPKSFRCRYCGVEFAASNEQVDEMFRKSLDVV